MRDKEMQLEMQVNRLKELRTDVGLKRKEFSDFFGIPLRTIEDWEAGRRKMPEYVLRLLEYKVRIEKIQTREDSVKDSNIQIICDPEGKKVVLINDIRFKGKNREEWDEIEEYLRKYIGRCYEIAETSEKVFIGKEFPNEFAHAKDKTILRGPNAKAKANSSQVVGELIQIATNKTSAPDYNSKHKNKAKYGWYRYDTRLALPVYNDDGEVVRYNIFKIRMLVRHDSDGKLYLYDFLRTKKETSSPL